jgi:acetyl esterase/lipase
MTLHVSLGMIVLALGLAVLVQGTAFAAEREVVMLWPDGAPGAKGTTEKDTPNITVYLPEKGKATGGAVVVCPGGGYGGLAVDHEGEAIGNWFNDAGITAFVLRYRVSPYRHPIPMNDAKRAMRLVRLRAKDWGIDPNRLGIMGFSAGGHLTATIATLFDKGDPNAAEPIDQQSCRPDFAILCYPVITFKPPFAHMGSRHNLLGKDAPEDLVESLCHENNVTDETPPIFIFHTADDAGVPSENSLQLFMALRAHKIPAEMHIYEHGRHGVGLAPDMPELNTWPGLCMDWLKKHGILEKAK